MKSSEFQLIPVRGRKLVDKGNGVRSAVISTYPRKGTETVMDDFATGYLDFNLSPQGDGNIGMTA